MSLKLSKDLSLPAEEFLEAAGAIIGKRGRGKSGLVKVVLEEMCEAGLPFVAFDPVGILWGLRSSADGKGAGYKVLVVGGSHGDLRLDRRAGAEVARAVIQSNVSVIVDFSEESKGIYREFVAAFADTLYKENTTPRLVVIEEAPELVPQHLRPDMTVVFEAVERLVSRGRNKGLGVIMVSQRAATINKDVLTQVDWLACFGVTSPQDRKALHEWVEAKADPRHLKTFEEGLAGLEKQQAWFWSPEAFGGQFRAIKVRPMRTFHPDKTHLRRMGLLEARPVQPDIEPIIKRLGKAMDGLARAKEEKATVAALQARIRVLEARPATKEAPTGPDPVAVRRATEAARRAYETEAEKQATAVAKAERTLQAADAALKRFSEEWQTRINQTMRELADGRPRRFKRGEVPAPPVHRPTHTPPIVARTAPFAQIVTPRGVIAFQGDGHAGDQEGLTTAHRRILEALSKLEAVGVRVPTKVQAALWAGFSPLGGYYNNMVGRLRSGDLVAYPTAGTISLTDEGRKLAGSQPPMSVEEFHQQVFSLIGNTKARILKVLLEFYPEPLVKADLAEKSGFSEQGGYFNNLLGNLRSMGIVDYPRPGAVAAQRVLFLEGQ